MNHVKYIFILTSILSVIVSCSGPSDSALNNEEGEEGNSETGGTIEWSVGEESDTYWVTNPTSGASQFVQVLHPDSWNGQSLPAYLMVPGGTGDSTGFSNST